MGSSGFYSEVGWQMKLVSDWLKKWMLSSDWWMMMEVSLHVAELMVAEQLQDL